MNKVKKFMFIFSFAIALSITQAKVYGEVTVSSDSSVMKQIKTVTATVADKTGEPMPGVNVIGKGISNSGAVSDINGRFTISVNANSTLELSFLGYKTVEISAAAADGTVITLYEDALNLNEVIITGYTTQRKTDLTGAVSVLDIRTTRNIPVGNPLKAMQGQIAGVYITTDGTPNGSATVRIRGIGTLGNNDPLYIIDGVPTKSGIEQLNDIESFQVLKDASSASIYGSRAANGVIIITTKKGKKGVNKITLNTSLSTQVYNTKIDVMDVTERGEAFWRAAINDGVDPNAVSGLYQFDWNTVNGISTLNKVIIPEYIDANRTMKSANTNWFNEVSHPSLIQSYDLAISNGGENSNSMISLGYYGNSGIIKETFADRFTGRINSEYYLFNKRLTVGENISANYIVRDRVPATGGDGVLFNSFQVQPIVPVHTVDGGWGGPASGMTDKQNPVRQIEDNKQNRNYYLRLLGNVYADFEIIPRLHFKSSLGFDYFTAYQRTLRKSYVSGSLSDPSNQVRNEQKYDGNLSIQNTLTYIFNTGKHNLDFLLGNEIIKYNYQEFSASRQGLILENMDYAYLDAGTGNIQNNGSGTSSSLLSFFGKANYVYDNRYLASVTIRRDGSSRFSKNNRYGTFPAFSLGWRINEESFFKNALSFVSNLKLRFGWGENGNQEIANNAVYTLYRAIYGTDRTWNPDGGTAYDIKGNNTGELPSGFVRSQIGNESLKWETTRQTNYGIDFGFLNNTLSGYIDYFQKKTSDILIIPPQLAVNGGGTAPWINGASMENKGVELQLSYFGLVNKDFNYTISGNFSTYRNKVTELPSNSLNAYPGNGTDKTIIGRPINSYFGYVADGLFTSQEQVDQYVNQPGKGLGRIRYRDLNNDNVINDKDRDYIGNRDPDFTYGLNMMIDYKKFDFTIFFQGVSGIDVNNGYKSLTDFSSIAAGTNWGKRVLDAWTPQNLKSTIPAATLVDNNNENRFSTYFIESGSYLKLRNIQMGYTFAWGKTKSVRIYLQGSNILTIKSKSFTAKDPELPYVDQYPIPSIYTVGFNFSF